MAKFKIEQKLDDCINCGACVSLCEDNWERKGDKCVPIKTEFDEIGCNEQAVMACPVQCIKIVKK